MRGPRGQGRGECEDQGEKEGKRRIKTGITHEVFRVERERRRGDNLPWKARGQATTRVVLEEEEEKAKKAKSVWSEVVIVNEDYVEDHDEDVDDR